MIVHPDVDGYAEARNHLKMQRNSNFMKIKRIVNPKYKPGRRFAPLPLPANATAIEAERTPTFFT